MQAVQLTKDIEAQGLREGDVIQVDELSAKSLIGRKVAKEYDPEKDNEATELPEVEYGGQKVRTIDDIVDPDAKRMKGIVHVQRLVDADPGPHSKTVKAAEKSGDKAADRTATDSTPDNEPPSGTGAKNRTRGASGAQPAGADDTGGAS